MGCKGCKPNPFGAIQLISQTIWVQFNKSNISNWVHLVHALGCLLHVL